MKPTTYKTQNGEAQLDRVTYSFERAVKHYGNGFSVFASLSVAIRPGETPAAAFERARGEVEAFAKQAVEDHSQTE